jgi:hypothetical protein
VAELLEVGPRLLVHGELRAAAAKVFHLGALVDQRSALVEGDLVDAERALEVGEQADQRLADGPGSDDVHDLSAGHA